MNFSAILDRFRLNVSSLAGPILIMLILTMMILPLPPVILDIFFTFNIAVSIIVLMIGLQVKKPLEFSVFPSVLLVTTLLRLSLNVASSRIILMNGHNGPDAAGKVIEPSATSSSAATTPSASWCSSSSPSSTSW